MCMTSVCYFSVIALVDMPWYLIPDVKASVEWKIYFKKSEVRVIKYPPLGVISHPKQHNLGHWTLLIAFIFRPLKKVRRWLMHCTSKISLRKKKNNKKYVQSNAIISFKELAPKTHAKFQQNFHKNTRPHVPTSIVYDCGASRALARYLAAKTVEMLPYGVREVF